ncbi:hypothetical protein SAY86_011643 [Trapa natans]|uniref:Uncharacterized protein n=1 Tax=Trapa natans TaxID=22666 RepID=A0AAN7LVZ5_TRANT|nr:hypothetical protein SAY86_011643 [Trapa natans]
MQSHQIYDPHLLSMESIAKRLNCTNLVFSVIVAYSTSTSLGQFHPSSVTMATLSSLSAQVLQNEFCSGCISSKRSAGVQWEKCRWVHQPDMQKNTSKKLSQSWNILLCIALRITPTDRMTHTTEMKAISQVQ